MILERLTGKVNELELLQRARQLDDEVHLIASAGYKEDLAECAKERFVLKPFMIQTLFHMTGRHYRTVVH